ncbi:hypothetical protein ACJ72_05256 [Emergomyces africanus]|uniref:2-hydroxyacyl-CoA lyase n=1 Tax=Emergomyces africanus TaxID=1955775 RepID=A0A1B7NUE8_9EURO|nr:hypothetical protein ACJ72_05256 [Emergomyces africanus]
MPSLTGAQIVARSLHDLGVTVIFGIVGIPVVEIAEEAINLGIRFIAFRNEQACSYAASVYGYMSGKPGVCLVVGGPGVLHAMAGIGNAAVNTFPLLVLAGSAESHIITKGGFQEMDAISLLTPHTKLSVRPPSPESVNSAIRNAYRTCWYGRPGPTFIDLPADLIQGKTAPGFILPPPEHTLVPSPPKPSGDPAVVSKVAQLLRSARAPLVVVGKGSAYARAEFSIREFVERTGIPFLPTPMGKGMIPDSHPLNTSSARSTALKHADVVLLLGARLNWILHFGETPRWSHSVKLIQVDINAQEIGSNAGDAALGIVGDISLVIQQLLSSLSGWQYKPASATSPDSYPSLLAASATKNENSSQQKALLPTKPNTFLTFQRAYHIIKTALNSLSPPEEGNIVYVSEGANTMDISRSSFPLEHPRQRLDAGTYATMGVGLGYIVAAHAAYNINNTEKPKKIVALEGDSAFGFSAMEVETLARHRIPALIFVMNNSEDEWKILQDETVNETNTKNGLRSTSLLYETRYEHLAAMCGGRGYFVRTEEELERATREGFLEDEKVTIVNVIVEPGIGQSIQFGWQAAKDKGSEAKL